MKTEQQPSNRLNRQVPVKTKKRGFFLDTSMPNVEFMDELDRREEEKLFEEVLRTGVIRTY